MFAVFSRKSTAESAAVEPVATATAPDLRDAVQSIARQASRLGKDAAEVRGLIDDSAQVSQREAQAMQSLAQQVHEVQRAQDGIAQRTGASREAVERARGAVEQIGNEVGAIVDTLREVAGAAQQITQIALQTRLVAFNASVEAKRAGEAGRGFAVVADAVKDLSARVETSSKDIMRTVGALDERIGALAKEIRTQPGSARERQGGFHRALAEVQDGVGEIAAAAEQSRGICAGLNDSMRSIEREMQQALKTLGVATTRSESFLKVSEELIEVVADCGIDTEDSPYIRGAQQAASQVSRLLEDAVRTGALGMAQLFDEHYRPVEGSSPQQHTTAFCALTDRLFPQVQEKLLELSGKVVFCIAVDRNGYVPTHNRRYCQPQRAGDTAWNTANSRWRRIFADRTGLASARNTKPFLLQTYRRDMGGGNFVLMKEASAPIVVNGRHWGGIRLAFQF